MSSPADTKVLTVETKAKGGMVYIVHGFFLGDIPTVDQFPFFLLLVFSPLGCVFSTSDH